MSGRRVVGGRSRYINGIIVGFLGIFIFALSLFVSCLCFLVSLFQGVYLFAGVGNLFGVCAVLVLYGFKGFVVGSVGFLIFPVLLFHCLVFCFKTAELILISGELGVVIVIGEGHILIFFKLLFQVGKIFGRGLLFVFLLAEVQLIFTLGRCALELCAFKLLLRL